ncbi:hypothetical protein LCGC14_1244150 [marine sediment metagenome]|uniref:Uncharacterized protein n=1 Tax=marine sediment metagenome TaxID=412755 RepID=A0A0F9L8T2_9ZZZZ
MPDTKIGSATASDLTNKIVDFSVDTQSTDGIFDQKESKWQEENWTTYFGYYTDEKIPEITSVIDALATWTVGKGVKTLDEDTELILMQIRGFGFDTFNSILENAMRTMQIGGNFYAEIIRDKNRNLINLKPLDPSVMVHIAGRNGQIKRFEQTQKTKGQSPKKFKPDQIFYLCRNRVADEIHGRGIIQKLKLIIDMKNEAMGDWRRVLHWNVDPRWIFHLDFDDPVEVAAFVAKNDAAKAAGGENMYIPKDAVVPEVLGVAPNASLNPLPWIAMLDDKFYMEARVPKIIVGGAGGLTEAAVKIAYLAFQQTIEEEQLFIEEQVLLQLGLVIELEFPASLENELLSDNKKDGPENIDANDTTAGSGK